MYVKYCLPVRVFHFGHDKRTLQRGLSAIAEHLVDSTITQLQHSLQQISSWITANLFTLNSSQTEFLLSGLLQQLAKINTSSLITLLSLLATFLSLIDTLLSLTKYLLSLNLAVIIFVNFAVFVLILTSKLPVPSLLLSFILYLTTATHCTIIFHSLR